MLYCFKLQNGVLKAGPGPHLRVVYLDFSQSPCWEDVKILSQSNSKSQNHQLYSKQIFWDNLIIPFFSLPPFIGSFPRGWSQYFYLVFCHQSSSLLFYLILSLCSFSHFMNQSNNLLIHNNLCPWEFSMALCGKPEKSGLNGTSWGRNFICICHRSQHLNQLDSAHMDHLYLLGQFCVKNPQDTFFLLRLFNCFLFWVSIFSLTFSDWVHFNYSKLI